MASNSDFIALALYELGGSTKYIHVEDIFNKCFELSPGRFGWKKYAYPNYKTTYKALNDFEDNFPSLILNSSDGLSRQLTSEGIDWIKNNKVKFNKLGIVSLDTKLTKRPSFRNLDELLTHPLYLSYLENREVPLSKMELSGVFKCSPDSPTDVWEQRLESYKTQAKEAELDQIYKFLIYIDKQKPSWVGE